MTSQSSVKNSVSKPSIFSLVQRKILYVQTLFAPTDGQFNRNIDSIRSLHRYIEKFGCSNCSFYFAGWGRDDLIQRMQEEINDLFARYDFHVTIFERNYGKAYVVNKIIEDSFRLDEDGILFLFDSDIIFDIECEYLFDRAADIVALLDGQNGKEFGILAFDQRDIDCHYPSARENASSVRSWYGVEELRWPSVPSGIAGSAWVTSLSAWRTVGGYRHMGVYAGDDAFYLHDIAAAGFSYQLLESIWIIHPRDNDAEYARWKETVCARDSGSPKSDIEGIVSESETFWARKGWQPLSVVPDSAHQVSEVQQGAEPLDIGLRGSFALLSWHGTVCTVAPDGSQIRHERPDELGRDRCLLVVGSAGGKQTRRLVDCLLRPIGGVDMEILSGFLGGTAALRINDRYLCAEVGGAIKYDSEIVKEWESFFLVEAERVINLLEMVGGDWVSAYQKRKFRGVDVVNRLLPLHAGCVDIARAFSDLRIDRIDDDKDDEPYRVDVFRESWRLERFERFKPLIYFVICGHALLGQFRIAAESLFEIGRYQGEILVITDLDAGYILDCLPEEMHGRCRMRRVFASDYLDFVSARLLLGDMSEFANYQPIIYSDLDVIFDMPIEPILTSLLFQDGFDAQVERENLAVAKDSTGKALFEYDDIRDYAGHGFNAGILGMPSFRICAGELRIVRDAICGYVKTRGREGLAGRDQAMANYIFTKIGRFCAGVIDRSTRVPLDRSDVISSGRAGFVHFWPFGADREAAMQRYLDALRTIE